MSPEPSGDAHAQEHAETDPQSPPAPPEAPGGGERTFVVLMETSGDECESWYYFIRREGNEEVLAHLQAQLEQIEMYIEDGLSTFDLDTDHPVSGTTASEMTGLELNSVTFHRKFNGKMQPVNVGLRRADSNERRLSRLNSVLGLQKIGDFVDDEEIHPGNILAEDEEEDESDHEGEPFLVEPLEMS